MIMHVGTNPFYDQCVPVSLVFYIHKKYPLTRSLCHSNNESLFLIIPPPVAATVPQPPHTCILSCPSLSMLSYLFLPKNTWALPCNKILGHLSISSSEAILCRLLLNFAHPGHSGLSLYSHNTWNLGTQTLCFAIQVGESNV